MKVHLHIDRVVLEGIDLEGHRVHTVQGAIVSELERLLDVGELDPALLGGANHARRQVQTLDLHHSPVELGRRIGLAAFQGIRG